MDQYASVFEGVLGTVIESDGTEARLGKYVVKAVFDEEEAVDEFYVDGELFDYCDPIDDEGVDFSTIQLVCFRSNGYRGTGCYFALGLLDDKIILIDTMDGSIY